MKPPRDDISDSLPLSALDSQEQRRIQKLVIDADTLLMELDRISKLPRVGKHWRQAACVATLTRFVRVQGDREPIAKILAVLTYDLLDKTRVGNVRTGTAAWLGRVKCIQALIMLEEFMKPADALNLVLSKKRVVALISAYQKRDSEGVVNHGETVKKWRKQLENGATGHTFINMFYKDIVGVTRQRAEKLTKEQMRKWADRALAEFD